MDKDSKSSDSIKLTAAGVRPKRYFKTKFLLHMIRAKQMLFGVTQLQNVEC